MAFYQKLQEIWNKPTPETKALWRERLIAWRKEPATLRIEKPTRLDRARALGYRAKQGIIVVRQRVDSGGHERPKRWGGRKSKQMRKRLILRKNYQLIAEERACKKYPNCEVINSYYVAEDGKHKWYEVILADRNHPAVVSDKRIAWIKEQRGRAERGLTSAGKKVRGLRWKGKGAEKARPSRRANL